MMQSFPQNPEGALVQIVGLAILSGTVAGAVAFVHRWYARQRVPAGLAILAGVGAVGISLGTWKALQPFIGGNSDVLILPEATKNVTSFVVAGVTATVGARIGDRLTTNMAALSGATKLDDDVSRIVGAVGRMVTVTLPENIDDIDGYDAVSDETKATLAGSSFVFPRGITVSELRERVVARLEDDHGIGHVDIDLASDGTVEYLALGSRVAGLGPLLVPGTVAVAIRADPAFSAGAGDFVTVWRHDGSTSERVTTGEIRGVVEDVVTLAVDASEATKFGTAERYRLETLPRQSRPEREFVTRLRSAEETMGVLTVDPESDLVGLPVGSLDATVVAVRPTDGTVETLPLRGRLLAEGDDVYVVAQPTVLRRIERVAETVVETIDVETTWNRNPAQ
ncbi:potassium transporter TrkA [Haladaptatus sp. DFWS20]|uniref:potassium transporter TrkA n=1 Tax=Haladaptatus sp. DFWS20 TaxID=3403467 RepID=UPI003EBDC77F